MLPLFFLFALVHLMIGLNRIVKGALVELFRVPIIEKRDFYQSLFRLLLDIAYKIDYFLFFDSANTHQLI